MPGRGTSSGGGSQGAQRDALQQMVDCAGCGALVLSTRQTCPHCGAPMAGTTGSAADEEMLICADCGLLMSPDDEECPHCSDLDAPASWQEDPGVCERCGRPKSGPGAFCTLCRREIARTRRARTPQAVGQAAAILGFTMILGIILGFGTRLYLKGYAAREIEQIQELQEREELTEAEAEDQMAYLGSRVLAIALTVAAALTLVFVAVICHCSLVLGDGWGIALLLGCVSLIPCAQLIVSIVLLVRLLQRRAKLQSGSPTRHGTRAYGRRTHPPPRRRH